MIQSVSVQLPWKLESLFLFLFTQWGETACKPSHALTSNIEVEAVNKKRNTDSRRQCQNLGLIHASRHAYSYLETHSRKTFIGEQ